MPTFPLKTLWLCALLFLAACPAAAQQSATPEARAAALLAVRQAAAARGDVDLVNGKIAAARALIGEQAYDRELARLEELAGYVLRFWEHAEGVAKRLKGTEELEIGEQRVAVVEYKDGNLVLRVAGQNKTYTKATMPARLALTLATRELDATNAGTKVYLGAFLALDGKGDRQLARQYWDEAAKAGTDITRLLPELDVPQPMLPAAAPAMSPALRGLLAERNFTLRRQAGAARTREASANRLNQNAEGRLDMQLPAEESAAVQVITKRAFTGDFQAAFVIEVKEQPLTVGVYSSADGAVGRTVTVPAGIFLVKITRTADKYLFKVGERNQEPQLLAQEKPRTPLVLGWQLAPGQSATLLALETAGR